MPEDTDSHAFIVFEEKTGRLFPPDLVSMFHSAAKIAAALAPQRLTVSCALFAASAVFLAFGSGCSKPAEQAAAPSPQEQQSATPAAAPMPPIDPCSLLTTEEIQAVQGEQLASTKPSVHPVQGLAMYDCFFTLPTFTNSISLSITKAALEAMRAMRGNPGATRLRPQRRRRVRKQVRPGRLKASAKRHFGPGMSASALFMS